MHVMENAQRHEVGSTIRRMEFQVIGIDHEQGTADLRTTATDVPIYEMGRTIPLDLLGEEALATLMIGDTGVCETTQGEKSGIETFRVNKREMRGLNSPEATTFAQRVQAKALKSVPDEIL